MKGMGNAMGVVAIVLTIIAILLRLAGKTPMGISTRALLELVTVLLLMGINSSLLGKSE